jgi:hypothetical protein
MNRRRKCVEEVEGREEEEAKGVVGVDVGVETNRGRIFKFVSI